MGRNKTKSMEDKHFSNVQDNTFARIFAQLFGQPEKFVCVYRWGLLAVRGNFDMTSEIWYSG